MMKTIAYALMGPEFDDVNTGSSPLVSLAWYLADLCYVRRSGYSKASMAFNGFMHIFEDHAREDVVATVVAQFQCSPVGDARLSLCLCYYPLSETGTYLKLHGQVPLALVLEVVLVQLVVVAAAAVVVVVAVAVADACGPGTFFERRCA